MLKYQCDHCPTEYTVSQIPISNLSMAVINKAIDMAKITLYWYMDIILKCLGLNLTLSKGHRVISYVLYLKDWRCHSNIYLGAINGWRY